MHYGFAFTIVTFGLVINILYNRLEARQSNRNARENTDVFKHLLGYYKLNPLKSSQVYKTFTDYMLSGGEKHSAPYYDSNESAKKQVKLSLQQIEKVIHVKNKKHRRTFDEPAFDVNNVDIENFNVDVILNDKTPNQSLKDGSDDIENFSTLFTHIGSNEMNDKDHNDDRVQKLVPVNIDHDLINSPNIDFQDYHVVFNGTTYNYIYRKNKTVEKTDSFKGVRNEIEDGGVMSDSDTAHVVVL